MTAESSDVPFDRPHDRPRAERAEPRAGPHARPPLADLDPAAERERLPHLLPVLAWMATAEGDIDWLTEQAVAYLGASLRELVEPGWQRFVHADDLPALLAARAAGVAAGRTWEREVRLRRHDGVYRWHLLRSVPHRDRAQRVARWYGAATDVEELRATQAALRAGEESLQLLIDSSPDMMWIATPDGAIEWANARAERFLGVPMQAVLGDGWTRVLHPDDVAATRARWLAALESGRTFEAEYRLRRADGEYCWHLARALPHTDADGRIVKWFGIVSEVDQLHRSEERLRRYARLLDGLAGAAVAIHSARTAAEVTAVVTERARTLGGVHDAMVAPDGAAPPTGWLAVAMRARDGRPLGTLALAPRADEAFTEDDRAVLVQLAQTASVAIENVRLVEQLEEAVRARDELTAIVSHDLRNPLNTIALSTTLLRTEHLSVEERDAQLEVVQQTARHMNRLVADLLTMAQAEAGALAVELAPTTMDALLEDTRQAFAAQAAQAGVLFACASPHDLPPVHADRERVRQVLGNLVGNALRFTGRGGRVTVTAAREGARVRVSVQDTGVGMTADEQARAFDRFWQASRGARGGTGTGAGLGLAIARALVEAHGGPLRVESAPGRGTTFHFTLPLAVAGSADWAGAAR